MCFLGHWIEHFSNCIAGTCMVFLLCSLMIGLWSTRTICTVLAFVRNVFWCDLWDRVRVMMHNHIVCNCVASAHCVWACAFSDYQLGQRTLGILNSCVLSPHCGWSCASLRSLALDASVYVLSLLWVNMWIFKWPAWPKDFWHSEHLCILSQLERANYLPFCFGLTWIGNTQHRGARRT